MEYARGTEDKRYNGTSLHRNHKMNTPVKRMIFFAMLLHNVCHKTSIFSEPPGTRCILWRRNKEEKCDVTLPWWQNFSISAIFLDRNGHLRCRTMEEKFGLLFCSECNHAQESHTCQCCPRICGTTVCWGPDIVLPWQRDVTTSPLCRPFARWRHFTTRTRILFVFPFIFKFGNPSEIYITKA